MAYAGSISVKVIPDIDDFTDTFLDALAEKVAARIVEKNMPREAE